MNDEIKKYFDMALFATKYNHPDWNIGENLKKALNAYIDYNFNNSSKKFEKNDFFKFFSEKLNLYGINVRQPLFDYVNSKNIDISLLYLDYLFNFCKIEIGKLSNKSELSITEENKRRLYSNYFVKFLAITGVGIQSLSNQPYKVIENLPQIYKLIDLSENITNRCIDSINANKDFNFPSINAIEVTKTAKQVLTNNDSFFIRDSFGGKLLGGKISIESNKGYINYRNKTQQDSVLSSVKSENCFLNVVADGAGGATNAEKASMTITTVFKNWFDEISEKELSLKTTEELEIMVNDLINGINNYLIKNYKDCYSTVVIALTVNGKTIIANVGDSTAYSYDENSDELNELTTLDSASYGLSYDEARFNPNNNRITAFLGDDNGYNGLKRVHFNVIDNVGQRIILSSDGVTDLVEERRFKNYFRNKNDAQYIVNDAVYNPGDGLKRQDNVSAIVIDLPNDSVKRRGGI